MKSTIFPLRKVVMLFLIFLVILLVGSMILIFNLFHHSSSSANSITNTDIYVVHFNSIDKLDAKTRTVLWHREFRKVNSLSHGDVKPVIYQ